MVYAVDVPPPIFPVARIEQSIDFDPYRREDRYSYIYPTHVSHFILRSTSSEPQSDVRPSVAAMSFTRTTASARERSLELSARDRSPKVDVPGQLFEVKKLTGASWELLATLLGCSRQALHNWTLGEPIAGSNRDRLSRLHATIKFIDRGNAEENRALLDMAIGGATVSDLLRQGRFEEVNHAVGRGVDRTDESWGKVGRISNAADHWYTRLVSSGDLGEAEMVRANPQTFKRLKLKKG